MIKNSNEIISKGLFLSPNWTLDKRLYPRIMRSYFIVPDPKKRALSVRQNDTWRQDITIQKHLVAVLRGGRVPDLGWSLSLGR
jgi:hypothetical protein